MLLCFESVLWRDASAHRWSCTPSRAVWSTRPTVLPILATTWSLFMTRETMSSRWSHLPAGHSVGDLSILVTHTHSIMENGQKKEVVEIENILFLYFLLFFNICPICCYFFTELCWTAWIVFVQPNMIIIKMLTRTDDWYCELTCTHF